MASLVFCTKDEAPISNSNPSPLSRGDDDQATHVAAESTVEVFPVDEYPQAP